MSPVRQIRVILFFVVHLVYLVAHNAVFKLEGNVIEIGYCFGVDYITVFRSAVGGDQLLANSSEAPPLSLSEDLVGRLRLTNQLQLLGLEIKELRQSDSGMYRWECWKDKALANKGEQELLVCSQEILPVEISEWPNGGVELTCNINVTSMEGKNLRWYYDMWSSDNVSMVIDTSVSLAPLQDELRGVIDVKDRGTLLSVSGSLLNESHNFYCLVMNGQKCLKFQNFYFPENDEIDLTHVYTSMGEEVVLLCPFEKSDAPRWKTPMGDVIAESTQFTISVRNNSFSLVFNVQSAYYAGGYKCHTASLLLAEYVLVLCPISRTTDKLFHEGDDVVLQCDQGKEENHRVQWYRRRPLEGEQLILDSSDRSIIPPADLRGRVVFSEQDSSLRLSAVNMQNRGEFWCVTLNSKDLYDNDYSYEDYDGDENVTYNDKESSDEYTSNGSSWFDEYYTCISKQVTSLRENQGRRVDPNIPVDTEPVTDHTVVIAVCGGLAGLIILAVIVAVVIKKKQSISNSVI